jgi:hypothetical protein
MKEINVSLLALVFSLTSISYGAGTEVTDRSTPAAPAKQSITDSADKTKSSNEKGQIMNMVMGGATLAAGAKCAGTCPYGCCSLAPMLFMMGMQNLMQAGEQGKTAGQAGGTVNLTDTGLGTSGYDPNAVKDLLNGPDAKAGKEFMATVAKGGAGFSYDPKTGIVTTASGKTLKGSDMNSASSMAAAGIPKGAIDALSNMVRDIEAKTEKKVGKLALTSVSSEESSSGGGGGSGSASAASNGEAPYGSPAGRSAGLGIDRDPAQVAGMQKNYNGEPIGVAGDSIFKMMTRRYKTKEAQSSFIDESDILTQK